MPVQMVRVRSHVRIVKISKSGAHAGVHRQNEIQVGRSEREDVGGENSIKRMGFSTVFVLLIKLNPTRADLTHYSQLLVVKKA